MWYFCLFVCLFIFLGGCWASWIWKLRIISTNLGEIWYYVFKYLLLLFIFSFWVSNCWATWYWPYVSVVLLCFFSIFLLSVTLTGKFPEMFLQIHQFFLLPSQIYCWTCLLIFFFISVVTLFKYRILKIPFYIFYFCVNNSFLSWIPYFLFFHQIYFTLTLWKHLYSLLSYLSLLNLVPEYPQSQSLLTRFY